VTGGNLGALLYQDDGESRSVTSGVGVADD
jgi:hypothetical protein